MLVDDVVAVFPRAGVPPADGAEVEVVEEILTRPFDLGGVGLYGGLEHEVVVAKVHPRPDQMRDIVSTEFSIVPIWDPLQGASGPA